MNKAIALSTLLIASAALAENPTVTPKLPAIADGCFQVGTVEELYGFAAAINGTDGIEKDTKTECVEITSNIVVNENVLNKDGDLAQDTATYILWEPPSYFVGTIKGNGHTISGFATNRKQLDNSLTLVYNHYFKMLLGNCSWCSSHIEMLRCTITWEAFTERMRHPATQATALT